MVRQTVVADIGGPFHAEERQRDVWNEASALGLQLFIWGGVALVGVMVWAGGRTLVPWAIALWSVDYSPP